MELTAAVKKVLDSKFYGIGGKEDYVNMSGITNWKQQATNGYITFR